MIWETEFEDSGNACELFLRRTLLQYADKPGVNTLPCGVCGRQIKVFRRDILGKGHRSAAVPTVQANQTVEAHHA